jgi:hypothetical protein
VKVSGSFKTGEERKASALLLLFMEGRPSIRED